MMMRWRVEGSSQAALCRSKRCAISAAGSTATQAAIQPSATRRPVSRGKKQAQPNVARPPVMANFDVPCDASITTATVRIVEKSAPTAARGLVNVPTIAATLGQRSSTITVMFRLRSSGEIATSFVPDH